MAGPRKEGEPCVLATGVRTRRGPWAQRKWCLYGLGMLHGHSASHPSRWTSFLSWYLLSLSPSGSFSLIITNAALSSPRQFPSHFSMSRHPLQPNSPVAPMKPETQKTRGGGIWGGLSGILFPPSERAGERSFWDLFSRFHTPASVPQPVSSPAPIQAVVEGVSSQHTSMGAEDVNHENL